MAKKKKKKPPNKNNKIKKYENSLSYYKTIKTSLKSIIKHNTTNIKLNTEQFLVLKQFSLNYQEQKL